MARDFYDVLGVERDADLGTIREAYRNLAARLLPSRGGDPKAYAEVQDAYATLSNSGRRKQYDMDQQSQAKEDIIKPKDTIKPKGLGPVKPKVALDTLQEKVKPKQARIKVPEPAELEPVNQGLAVGELPEDLEKPVAHVIITEREGYRSLQLVHNYPNVDDGRLKPGQVLLAIRAAPLNRADLHSEDLFQTADIFGRQGIGQVVLVGPKVTRLRRGDWVLPMLEVDGDGDLVEDAKPEGTCRALVAFPEERCAKVTPPSQEALSVSQLAIAKSVISGFKMAKEFGEGLEEGTSVLVNCANGVVGQTLVQLLSKLHLKVFAVIRRPDEDSEDEDYEREQDAKDVERCKSHLRDLGASHIFFDDDDMKSQLESMGVPLARIAFDGVGGEATAKFLYALDKSSPASRHIRYGYAGGSKLGVIPQNWAKKWKGTTIGYSFDEWIQQNPEEATAELNEYLQQVTKMVQVGKLILDVEDHSTKDFGAALRDMSRLRRTHAVVVHFPKEDGQLCDEAAEDVPESASQVMAGPRVAANGTHLPPVPTDPATAGKPARMSWDLDFIKWEEEDEDSREKCKAAEGNLFKHDPVMDELRVMPFTDDALACPVALEIGEEKGKATQVIFWLPGEGEVPEEHGPWLSAFCANHPGVRALVLRPRSGFKWFEMSDGDAVKLGLNYMVVDDIDSNLEGDPNKSTGDVAFPPLNQQEVEALQQVEGVSMGLARRAVLEEREIESAVPLPGRPVRQLPFFFGGFGQGGTVALFAAACLMPTPVSGVVFSHSGVPAAGMLGKRLSDSARRRTKLCGVYDLADKEVPSSFPEALQHMFTHLGCRMTLDWLENGNGHDFFDDASARVMLCLDGCMEEADVLRDRPDMDILDPRRKEASAPQQIIFDYTFREKWRASVQRRGGKVSDMVLRGGALKVA